MSAILHPIDMFMTDCPSVNAELDIYRGTERCIAVNTSSSTVNMDTSDVTICTELYGGSANLLSLPENETESWNYLLTLIDE